MSQAASIRLRERTRPLGIGSFAEERLARRASRGDSAAFAAIFDRYHQDLYRYCLAVLRDSEDAEDALQSTMSSALSSLPGEHREIALRPWLFRVAHNHAISILRTRQRHLGEEQLATIADPHAQYRPEARERLRELIGDLEVLPDRQRAALTMRELSGLGFDEIGGALGISAAAARQAVYEARVSLKRFEEGRSMECARVQKLISASDERSLRALRLVAHLRACSVCRDFREAIVRREADLAELCQPLPALAAAGLLQGVLGGSASSGVTAAAGGAASAGGAGTSAGAAGALGGAGVAGKGIGASFAIKSASIVAAGAVGLGAADYADIIDVAGFGGGRSGTENRIERASETVGHSSQSPAVDGAQSMGANDPGASAPSRAGASTQSRGGGDSARHGDHHGPPDDASGNAGKPTEHANSAGAPAHTESTGPPPHAASGGPPAHANPGGKPTDATSGGPPAHANPGGKPTDATSGGPPAHANSGGQPSGTGSPNSPAQADSTGPPAHAETGGPPPQANANGDRSSGARLAGDSA